MKSADLTAEAVIQSIGTSKAASLGQLHRALGGKGSASGSLAKRLKELVPNIGELFAANKGEAGEEKATAKAEKDPKPEKKAKREKASKTAAKKVAEKPAKRAVKRADGNPFRDGSGYGLLFDILAAAGAEGMPVDAWKKKYMSITGKDEAHTRYDTCVLLSAQESPTGSRHRSCREGFWIRRECDNLVLCIG
jgi:hypothetical protein